ncbi:MAG: hypothetical protein Q7R95_11240 [bacterium]|nr:hypothetical protein [bacterium]
MNCIKKFWIYMDSIGKNIPNNWNPYEWIIETVYGKLNVSIHSDNFTKTGKPRKKYNNLASIYCRFEDFDRAKEFLVKVKGDKFPTNSKANYCCSGGSDEIQNWNYNFEHFKSDIEKILVSK